MNIQLRPMNESDLPFLFQVYATTRIDELAPLNWSAEQINAFINQQFFAQHHHYTKHYQGANFDVILMDEQPIGRIYVFRLPSEIRLMEITLLPEYRGRGIGGKLIQNLLDEADEKQYIITLHVEPFNPAMRLYERLGFFKVSEQGVYHFMKRLPATETA